jgi:RNA polymerase sigma-70 factor (ECF subfamily)
MAVAGVKEDGHAEQIRRVYPRVLAKLLGVTRSLADAEDALHDAVLRALESWTEAELPASAEAWLLTVAMNAHRDRLRRARTSDSYGEAARALAEECPWMRIGGAGPAGIRGWNDDLLGLLFACCHPALEDGESAALALATVVGFSIDEIAQAFVVAPRTMEQRLTRARQRLREKGDVEGPSPEGGHQRLGAVLRTIHLLFNEGYWSSTGGPPIRDDLCRLALELSGALAEAYPNESEVVALLALLTFHDARREGRRDQGGEPVPLPEQDRSRWNHDAVRQGVVLLDRALAAKAPGPFAIEAAIAAVHCRAPTAAETDWGEIAALYALLEGFRPTPGVRVNRAFAVGKARGPAHGLALLEGSDIDSSSYPYVHLVRGTLLAEAGQKVAAATALGEAARCARNDHERSQIEGKIARLAPPDEERGSSVTAEAAPRAP